MCDAHAGNTREVESLQCHLSGRLADTLSCQGADGFSWLHQSFVQFFYVKVEEVRQLAVGDAVKAIFNILQIFFVAEFGRLCVVLLQLLSFVLEICLSFA